MTRAEAEALFKLAGESLIAAGVPADVVRATLRPIWRAVLTTLRHREETTPS